MEESKNNILLKIFQTIFCVLFSIFGLLSIAFWLLSLLGQMPEFQQFVVQYLQVFVIGLPGTVAEELALAFSESISKIVFLSCSIILTIWILFVTFLVLSKKNTSKTKITIFVTIILYSLILVYNVMVYFINGEVLLSQELFSLIIAMIIVLNIGFLVLYKQNGGILVKEVPVEVESTVETDEVQEEIVEEEKTNIPPQLPLLPKQKFAPPPPPPMQAQLPPMAPPPPMASAPKIYFRNSIYLQPLRSMPPPPPPPFAPIVQDLQTVYVPKKA